MAEQTDKPSTPPSISSKYVLISIEKTEAPEGLPGTNWHEYIIERGNSQIVGKKPGSLKQVTEHAKAMITDLNERSGIPSSSTYASRQISKPKAATPATATVTTESPQATTTETPTTPTEKPKEKDTK
jgi:hypothetical protein